MISGSAGKQCIVLFGKESSFSGNKGALLKPLCTVDRSCAELSWFGVILTLFLCQFGAFEAQEPFRENSNNGLVASLLHFLTILHLYGIIYLIEYSQFLTVSQKINWAAMGFSIRSSHNTQVSADYMEKNVRLRCLSA